MVPLWLPDLLDGVRSATEIGVETVQGTSCRQFEADVDPSHAWSVLSDDSPTDSVERPVDVWIDDAHVRRIRARARTRVQTLELWDFGLSVDELVWTRFPAFHAVTRQVAVIRKLCSTGYDASPQQNKSVKQS